MASGRDPRRTAILVCGVLGLVLVIMIGTIITIRVTGDAAPDPSPPRPSPSPSPSLSSSPDRSPSAMPDEALPGCPEGDPTWTRRHTDDDHVHGGDLSFPPVRGAGFGPPKVIPSFSWWYDARGQTASLGAGRTAVVAVGAVAIRPGVYTPSEAARSSMLCLIGTSPYRNYTSRDDERSKKLVIDDQQGWQLITEVHQRGNRSRGMRITVITVDSGPPGSFSIFAGIAPIGDEARTKIISAAAADLRIGR